MKNLLTVTSILILTLMVIVSYVGGYGIFAGNTARDVLASQETHLDRRVGGYLHYGVRHGIFTLRATLNGDPASYQVGVRWIQAGSGQ